MRPPCRSLVQRKRYRRRSHHDRLRTRYSADPLDNCYHCHGPDNQNRKADLRLDTLEGATADLGGYAAVAPNDPDASELIARIGDTGDDVMPPRKSKRSLTPDQKQLLRDWIAQGAAWGKHWAFVPPTTPAIPQLKDDAPGAKRHPIDTFILKRLEDDGLEPSPRANRRALIRRLTLDLTGLPPTPEEVDAFLNDKKPGAYARVVDRLLASPHFGERVAWPWLDAARFSDTNGYQQDPTRTMWPWRDWAVNAINTNQPFDRFTVEQLAGDLLPDPTREQRIATGFNRNHMFNGEGGRIPEETRVENVFDRVETTATTFLGLTFTCARCHDHKYDPISQQDYYRLYDFFNQISETGGQRSGQVPPVIDLTTPEQHAKNKAIITERNAAGDRVLALENKLFPRPEGKKIGEAANIGIVNPPLVRFLEQNPRNRNVSAMIRLIEFFGRVAQKDAAFKPYVAALRELRGKSDHVTNHTASMPKVMVMDTVKKPRVTKILDKGLYNKPKGQAIVAALPEALSAAGADSPMNRLDLANWIVSEDNPLTARVIVNRYWQMVFGRGIVATPEDFGRQGAKPSHPELLDYLAVRFVRTGWDVKRLIHFIVTSETYKQSPNATPELLERDPDNELLARSPRYRLPSWMLRDQALAMSGLLVPTLGGPPVKPYQPPGLWDEATFGKILYTRDTGAKLYRRTLYTFWRRIIGPTVIFDNAKRQTCEVDRKLTNTPLHALVTLNETGYVEAARAMAERVMRHDKAPAKRINHAFEIATSRRPNAVERETLTRRLEILTQGFEDNPSDAEALLSVGESKRDAQPRRDPYPALNMTMNPLQQHDANLTRRALFGKAALGLGVPALASLLNPGAARASSGQGDAHRGLPGLPGLPHFAPKAKRVIYMLQNGAPSHVDLFDYKPTLTKMHGRQIPDEVVGGKRFSTMVGNQTKRPCLKEITRFKQHGQSGAWVSDFLPHTASIADKLCFIKSMHTEAVNHAPAINFFLTGAEIAGRPSMGAWLSYGLGSEAHDLPAFVAMTSRDKEASCGQIFYDFYWGAGFLPSKHQGVRFNGTGDPVLYISNPRGVSRAMRRGVLDDLTRLNRMQHERTLDPEITTRIAQYEMAYKMQASVPELTDLSKEPKHVLDMYGPDVTRPGSYAYNCLMARKLAEGGTRFIQIMHAGWDQHRNLNTQLKIQCQDTDAPSAALVMDLEQRGLLDDTLVIWGGEFGRTPFLQGAIEQTATWGRDHHPYAFTLWMTGGGIQPGVSYGASDDFGHDAVVDKVHVHDFQATVLNQLGIDHETLTYKYQGRYYRLTDIHGHVVKPILA
ncbi:MAG: DUF1501 domain-containing protein [Planctomycetota bacterium]